MAGVGEENEKSEPLVLMQNGVAAIEDSMTVSNKMSNEIIPCCTNSTSGISTPKTLESRLSKRYYCTPIITTVLFHNNLEGEATQSHQWINGEEK